MLVLLTHLSRLTFKWNISLSQYTTRGFLLEAQPVASLSYFPKEGRWHEELSLWPFNTKSFWYFPNFTEQKYQKRVLLLDMIWSRLRLWIETFLVLLYPRCIIWLIYRVVWSFCTQNLWWWRFVMLSPSYGYIARRLRSFRLSCLLQGLSYTWDRQILSLQLPYNKNNRENELILYSRIVITY